MKLPGIQKKLLAFLLAAALLTGDTVYVLADVSGSEDPQVTVQEQTQESESSQETAADAEQAPLTETEPAEMSDDLPADTQEEPSNEATEVPETDIPETDAEQTAEEPEAAVEPETTEEIAADPAEDIFDTEVTDVQEQTEEQLPEAASDPETVPGTEEEKKPEETSGDFTFTLDPSNNKYTVRIGSFSTPEEITGIRVKVWSEVKGDDDAKWLTLKSSATGSTYWASSYIKDFKNYGKAIAEFYMDKTDGSSEIIETRKLNIKAPAAAGSKVSVNSKKSSITVKLTGFESALAIDSVQAYIWRKSDKSDMKQYEMTTADGKTYVRQDIFAADFDNYSGTYHVRVLANVTNGPAKELVKTTAEIAASNGIFSYEDNYDKVGSREKSYKLKIKSLARENGISAVEFEFWHYGNYDERKTYKAEYDEAGFYYTNVRIRDYKYSGKYKTAIYVIEPDGTRVKIKTKDAMTVTETAGGIVEKKSENPEKGTFVVTMKDFASPSGVKSVRFGVWTKTDRSDKAFYTAVRKTDGSFQATIRIQNHGYNDGTFRIRPIVEMGNYVQETQAVTKITFHVKNIAYVLDKGNGRKTIGIVGPDPAEDIQFAVWGEKDGQNDIIWYPGKKSGRKWTAEVVCFNHGETGTYDMHVYAGKDVVATKTFKVKAEDLKKNGFFYENGLKFYYIDGELQKNYRGKVKGPYQICVNKTHCTITVYAKDGDNGFIQPISYFPCSVGLDWAPTPSGIFQLSSRMRWKHFYTWDTYVQYAVRYSEGRFFHSVTCTAPSIYALDPPSYNNLGSPASHGCIRLTVKDAKWIYDNIKQIAEVKIYESGDPGPFGKAPHIIIPPNQTWDPTDPAITG